MAVVGAYAEDSSGTGIAAGTDELSAGSGAIYVFDLDANNINWTQRHYVKAANVDADDHFGWAVALSGETIVVGAPFEDSNALSVDGDATNNQVESSGAAYVIR